MTGRKNYDALEDPLSRGNKFSRSTTSLRSSLPLVKSARTNFDNPKFELPEWAKAIPEYMNPDALKPAKQFQRYRLSLGDKSDFKSGYLGRTTSNLIDDIKREDEKILKK